MTMHSSPSATAELRLLRDRLVELLLLLSVVDRQDVNEADLDSVLVKLDLGRGWLGGLMAGPDADKVVSALPAWLTISADSGLQRVLDVYAGGNAKTLSDQQDRYQRLEMLAGKLGGETLKQLWALWEHCDRAASPAPTIGRATPDAAITEGSSGPHAAVLEALGGRVAITLAAGSTTPTWCGPLEWTGPYLQAAQDCVRRLLEPFLLVTVTTAPAVPAGVWLPSLPAEDAGVCLTYALDILAETASLRRPDNTRDVLALGTWTRGDHFAPMPDEELSDRMKALELVGITRVLAPSANGWVLAGPGEARESLPGPMTLDGAAALIWKSEWAEWKRDRNGDELRRQGWFPLELRPAIGDTHVKQVGILKALFQESTQTTVRRGVHLVPPEGTSHQRPKRRGRKRRVAVLGGTARSGKTTIARLLAAALKGEGWQVQAISSMSGQLPDRDPLIAAGQRAIAMLDRDENKPCLLILDGLLPMQGGNSAIDVVLPMVSDATGVSVLAVLQYDVSSNVEWSTDTIEVVPAVVGRQQLENFVQSVKAVRPAHLDRDAGLAAVAAGTRDLGVLVRAMETGEVGDAILACYDELGQRQRQVVADVAAATVTHSGVPEDLVSVVEEEDQQTLGIEQLPGRDLVKIASVEDSMRILQHHLRLEARPDRPQAAPNPTDEQVRRLIVRLVMPRLERAMRSEPDSVLPLLLGVRLYRGQAAADLLTQARNDPAFHTWLGAMRIEELARCLTALGTSLDEEITTRLIKEFRQRLHASSGPLRLHDLVATVRGLRHAMSTGAINLKEFRLWLTRQVNSQLDQQDSTSQERLHLLERVEWFHDPDLDKLIAKRVAEVVTALDPGQAADYFLVLRAIRLQRRLRMRLRPEEDALHYPDSPAYFPVDREPEPLRLLEHTPKVEDGFSAMLAGMMLRRRVERLEWEQVIDEQEDLFQPALENSNPRAIITALNELRRTSGMHRNEIFKRAVTRRDGGRSLSAWQRVLRRATPMEAVELLRVIHSLHAWCACVLLKGPDGQTPDDEFVRYLAHIVTNANDPKAAGMLLSTTNVVEDPYLQEGSSFARRFGDQLGEETVKSWLVNDIRPAVKYYLIKGLWDAEVSYRDRCLTTMLDTVVQSLTTSRRTWGPRLALRIGADPQFGSAFLAELRSHVSIDDLLPGMSAWTPPDAQVEFHRLARALYPDAPNRFADIFDENHFAQRMANAAGVAVAEACREVARTLRYADAGGVSGAKLLTKTGDVTKLLTQTGDRQGPRNLWLERLDAAHAGEEFAQLLRLLNHTDRGRTTRLLKKFSEVTMFRDSTQESESRLVWKTRSAMYQNPIAATNMLAALEDVAGLGGEVYAQLHDNAVLIQIFTEELQLLQNPSEQYTAALHLSRIGVGRRTPGSEWMEKTFELKKLIIATVSSPRVIRDILRTMALWERRWALELIPLIEHEKLARRLRLGLINDVQPAIGLATLLLALDDRDGATDVLNLLADLGWPFVVKHAGLSSAVLVLRLAGELRPHHRAAIADNIETWIVEMLSSEVALDERTMWREIGHACQALDRAGYPMRTAAVVVARDPKTADAAAIARALPWLSATPWRQHHQNRAVQRLLDRPPRYATDLIHGLAGTAAAGQLSAFLATKGNLDAIADGRLEDLADLMEFAEEQPGLAIALEPYRPAIEARLRQPTSVGSWDARRLRQSLTRLVRMTNPVTSNDVS